MLSNTLPKTFTPADMGDFVAQLPIDGISVTAFVDMLSGLVLLADMTEFDPDGDVVTKYTVRKDWHKVSGLPGVPLKDIYDVVVAHAYEVLDV